jgi:signal peptidase I
MNISENGISSNLGFGNPELSLKKVPKPRRIVRNLGLPAILALICLLLVKTYFFNFLCVVTSESMAPTLKTRDLLLVSKADSNILSKSKIIDTRIKRGDIVVFHTEGLPIEEASKDEHYVKRVVGLPGDRVEIRGGKVFINGSKLTSPRIFKKLTYLNVDEVSRFISGMVPLVNGSKVVVPENHYFVLGDHSSDSLDSRYWGVLPHNNIEGKVIMKWWPLSGIGAL